MYNNTVIIDKSSPQTPVHYTKSKLLGKGGFASVYEVTTPTSATPLACKIIEKSSISKTRTRQKLTNEIRIHRSLSNTHILQFIKSFEDEQNLYILLEICPNESLSVLLRRRKRLLELEVQCYLVQVLLAIKYLRDCRVIHRDIKLGNVLLGHKMEVKLADFGLATRVEYEGERKRTICGTPNYIAPEILHSNIGHSYEVDIWSFGVLMYTMLVGKPPFAANDPKLTYSKIKSGFYNFPDSIPLSPQAKDLISKILVIDPNQRLGIDAIFDHSFFYKNKIPKFLPFSTLTVPLSTSYQKAFDKKPLSPREFLDHNGEDRNVTRSSSNSNQVKSMQIIGHEELERVSVEVSTSLNRMNDGDVVASCVNLNKIVICSGYRPVEHGPLNWVTTWIDYSHKYGLAYRMSNDTVGFLFNDQSKLLLSGNRMNLRYMDEKESNCETYKDFEISKIPSNLLKKVQLALCFSKKFGVLKSESSEISNVLVKKWILTQHAILFRLNNKVVQVYFRDQTEVLLCGINRIACYVNKQKETMIYPVFEVMDCGNRELLKRVKFCKEILLGGFEKKKIEI